MTDFMPAYCDPTNEFRGPNFDRDLDLKDIAKLVRKGIRAAIKSGSLPVGLKVSVTISRYSGGQTLNAEIKAAPYTTLSAAFIAWRSREDWSWSDDDAPRERLSAEARDAEAVINGLVSSFRRDNSDSQSDYFDCNFYKHVGHSSDLLRVAA